MRLFLPALLLIGWAFAAQSAGGAEISISCGAIGIERELCARGGRALGRRRPAIRCEIVSTPNSTTERLALYQQLLAAHAPDIDVFKIDVVWPGILGAHFIDLAPYAQGSGGRAFPRDHRQQHGRRRAEGDAVVHRCRVCSTTAPTCWRNTASACPTTWAELAETAAAIVEAERAAGKDRMWGFVFQGARL